MNEVECCANCKHLVAFPRGNSYGDVDYLCLVTGYYCHGIRKDRNKVEHYSPGGKKLECRYERRTVGFQE